MTREYTTGGELVMTGRRTPEPRSTAHLTDFQRSACEALALFHVSTERDVRTLLSMWTGRHLLYEQDIKAIVAELVGWQGSYTYDRDDQPSGDMPADVDGQPLGRAAREVAGR